MGEIKNIIFDFGNVLIDIDIPKAFDQLVELVGPQNELEDQKARGMIEHFNNELEVDAITEETFIWKIQNICHKTPQGLDVIKAFNAMLMGIPPHRFEMLEILRKTYKVFLLSNTNSIHFKWIDAYLERTFGIKHLEDNYFDKIWLSHEIKMRKPDPNIYKYILKDQNLAAEECLFIDDMPINIKAAQEEGLKGIVHDPKKGLDIDLMMEYIHSVPKENKSHN